MQRIVSRDLDDGYILLRPFASTSYDMDVYLRLYVHTPNLPTNIVGFKGCDSSIILIQRGGIPRFIGNFPESLTQAMLVGTILVGGLGVRLHGLSIVVRAAKQILGVFP